LKENGVEPADPRKALLAVIKRRKATDDEKEVEGAIRH